MAAMIVLSTRVLEAQQPAMTPVKDVSHATRFIAVEKDVLLEVIDWGGSGRPLVFLAGLGNTAHVFEMFAPRFTATNHVYGITRRGFGASSAPVPADGVYSADRLGDDVLAVIASLNLDRPVLVGHSIAGEELSSIGSRHPERIAGLIYLDAGYAYAYYPRDRGDLQIDANDLERSLNRLYQGGPVGRKPLVDALLKVGLPQLERDLQAEQKALKSFPDRPRIARDDIESIEGAIFQGEQKYTEIRSPTLAFFAVPHHYPGLENEEPIAVAAVKARDLADSSAQAKAFEEGIPGARVIRLPNADHYVFRSNEVDVEREMLAFLKALPQ
ncbi:alpha/beta fold hydrolase [Terriglobus sp. RCC_193]|uniref:alpha/beta fold hydrolase n=1 Tax=Terriglobus sp. RCC_193 TaxID=3239218 RepID=UPI00352630E7